MASNDQVDEIIERTDIVSIISEYVKLERKGNSYKGLCPFHKEKTPSFSVLTDRQIFKCFGCGKGGNVVHFIQMAEGLEYWDAIEFLGDKLGIKLERNKGNNSTDQSKMRQDVMAINKEAARFFFSQLTQSREGYQYFTKRGIFPETVKSFGLGFAKDDFHALIDHFKARDVSEKMLVTAGLVIPTKNDGYCDKFRNKVMFPIFDVLGNVVAFGGRVLDDSKPKYINSPETPVYTKGRHLYGLNFARKAESKRVIIVEGYMDCIALHQHGIKWVVAALGTALTMDQARLLKKYYDEVITCFDADSAGQTATLRGLDILAKCGFRVRVLVVPDGKDPDDYLKKHTADEFIKLADNAKTLVEYKISTVEKNFSPENNNTRESFLTGITGILAEIDDSVNRDMYVKWVSKKYDISQDSLAEQVEIKRAGGTVASQNIFMKKRIVKDVPPNAEKNTDGGENEELTQEDKRLDKNEKLFILLLSEDLQNFNRIRKKTDENFFKFEDNKELYRKLQERVDAGRKISKELLLGDAGIAQAEILSQIISKWLEPPDLSIACDDLIEIITKSKYDSMISEITLKLGSNDISNEEKSRLTKQLNEILMEKRKKK